MALLGDRKLEPGESYRHKIRSHIRLTTFLLACSFSLGAQYPLALLPDNYRLVFENETVRVVRVHYGPHEKLPVHDHSPSPTIYVYLNDAGPVRFGHVEQHAFSVTRDAVRTGAFRISPGRIEKHAVENLGDVPTDFLRVELKTIPLGTVSLAHRESKEIDLTKALDTVAFDCSSLTVRRIVAPGPGRQHYAGPGPGLLVALTAAWIGTDTKPLKAGEVFWAPASFEVEGEGSAAHLLWIVVK